MTFYMKESRMVKKEGGMMMEEYVLELYNLLYTTEWQDIVSFLGIVFCMKIIIVYVEEQGMFYSFSSPFELRREPLLNYANRNEEQIPFVIFFMIRFITAIVKKKESDDEECHSTCNIANVF
ncbi:hypothetical protein CN425_05915 [Bacillus cereus]|uniref:Group-specific protein n=2 Tax=Bacillus cereus TaxID=1396 RepID=A0A2A9UJE2_BACCE|nr:hypothetical protein CON38_03510 [Bacillus cereus]PEW04666.1 hypothetical protein CN425_05915 [Bacillus cereus]PFI24130.1 hypothetical protein COI75_14095 [Bacillus cereus]